MKIDTRLLTSLLKRTQRQQCVGGKPQNQVTACVLNVASDRVVVTSLVRDGKTSLSKFIIPAESKGGIALPLPDIDRVLGVLSSHSSPVSIQHKDDRLIFKSGKKTTRLTASFNGLAFPHSSDTVTAWQDKSLDLASRFEFDSEHFIGYRMADKSVRQPFFNWTVDANELFEALRCDSMNGQKLNRYTFATENGRVRIGVGEEMKGFTFTDFDGDETIEAFEWTFEGGLDNVLSGIGGNIDLHFLDFRKENQGVRMIINLGERGWVYQAGVL